MRESEQDTKTRDGIGREFDHEIQPATMPHGTAAAPALPFQILLPRLAEFCIPRTHCNILREDAIFQKIEFRCQPIADLRDIAESQHNIPLSINALARAFESNAHEFV
jgi:hypothetical protein